LQLATQAAEHGWPREVERHQATARRVAQLLADLGQPLNLTDTDEQT